MKWISAVQVQNGGAKTKRFEIQTKDGSALLGVVKWYAAWRRFAFFPEANTLYEPDCLRDIATFCEQETEKRKQERREELENLV